VRFPCLVARGSDRRRDAGDGRVRRERLARPSTGVHP